jgi:hypothetical protein
LRLRPAPAHARPAAKGLASERWSVALDIPEFQAKLEQHLHLSALLYLEYAIVLAGPSKFEIEERKRSANSGVLFAHDVADQS